MTLMVMYGYILLQGANLISNGSELLLEILDPGLIGGLVLPILGALPDTAIIVVSGSKASIEEVSVGIGTLAGSSILLLTLVWGGSVYLGRCDLDQNNESINKTLTKPWSLRSVGVTSDVSTMRNALVMILTSLPMLFVQIPASTTSPGSKMDNRVLLMGGILCALTLVLYLVYQLVSPELLKSKIRAARSKALRQHSIAMFSKTLQNMGHSGRVDKERLYELFDVLDTDHNGYLDKREAYVALTSVGSSLLTLNADLSMSDTEYILQALDVNKDGVISKDEFVEGLMRWVDERRHDYMLMKKAARKASLRKMSIGVEDLQASPLLLAEEPKRRLLSISENGPPGDPENGFGNGEGSETDDEDDDDDDDDDHETKDLTPRQIAIKSSLLLLAGALVVGIFSDPMVGAVSSFADSSGIPAFFVAFVVTPLASNSSEAVSSLKFAAKKKRRNFNLTFSQIYGAVALNNTMCLGLFYMVMYKNSMDWVYASETFSMFVVIIIVGTVSFFRKTFTAQLGLVIACLYPLSVISIYLLDTLLGWQ